MAEDIVIKTVLVLDDSGKRKLQQDVASALNSPEVQTKAREAGRKIGDGLNLGVETTRRSREDKELAHQRRLEAIAAQSNARILEIERRKQAQLDLIRERGVQKELEHARKIERAIQSGGGAISSLRSSVAGVSAAFGVLAGLGIVSLFERVGRAALDAAIDINRQVSSLTALTGSAELARKRFAELVALAQKTPGLTTGLAATLDAQLRVFNVAEQTINKLLPVIGRLNAIAPLTDPRQFVNNLTQLITQNFERQDLKELVNQSPIAGQLIKQIFNIDNPTNAKAIREAAQRLGVTSVERLAEELVKAGENNQALRSAVETLGGQFDKLRDRLNVALAPVGEELAKIGLQLNKDLVEAVERFGPIAAKVFRENRENIIEATRAVGDLLVTLGKLTAELANISGKDAFTFIRDTIRETASMMRTLQDLAELTAAGISFTFNSIVGGVAAAVQKALGVIGVEFETLNNLVRDTFGAAEKAFQRGQQGGINTRQLAERFQFADQFVNLDPERARALALAVARGDFAAIARVSASPQPTPIPTPAPGGGGSAGRVRRDRFVPDFGLGQTALLEHEAELARIRASNQAVVERRQRELEAAQRPAQLAGFSAALAERIRKQELEEDRLRRNTAAASAEDLLRAGRRGLTRSGRFIDDALGRGQLTAGEAELLSQGANREFANRLREVLAIKEKLLAVNDPLLDDLRDEIELFDRLGTSISSTERFMRGFNSQIDSVGDAFERFGSNVSRAFTNIKDLFGGLKQAVLSFFNDLVGQSLQNLVKSTLGSLFGNISGALGGVFGGGGNIFRTPSTFGNFAQAFAGAAGAGGGISAPPSVSGGGGILSSIGSFFSGGGGSLGAPAGLDRLTSDPFAATQFGLSFGGGKTSFLGGLKQSLGAAAPLLGLGLGGGLGGQSVLGQIAGSAGGLLAGGLATAIAAPSALSAGAAAFFTNPFTIAIGAGLLVGSFFLGKAKQRRQDEEAAGQLLGQAFQAVEQLAAGIAADQIDGGQARAILESQIVGPFVQQINSLKTASVRRDWVKNQVPEIRARFEANVVPLIAAQERRRTDAARFAAIDSRLIPQFAIGGTVPGIDRGRDSVMAMLRPGEKVLTLAQQASVISQSNPSVFDRAGVPRSAIQVGAAQAFQFGGTAQPSGSSGVTLYVQFGMSDSDARQILARAVDSRSGKDIVVDVIQQARDGGRRV